MAIKATIATHREGSTWVVQVSGWLSPESAQTLREALAAKAGPVRLDLAGLRFAEQSALGFIRLLEGTGVEIEGASPYIERLLRSAVPRTPGGVTEPPELMATAGRS